MATAHNPCLFLTDLCLFAMQAHLFLVYLAQLTPHTQAQAQGSPQA